MDMTNGPIFKSIMFALLVAYVALVSLGVWAAKGGKLPSEPRPGQFALVDAGGQLIGDTTISKDTSEIAVAFLVNEIQYAAWVSPEGFYSNGLLYDEMGCSGNAYTGFAQNRFLVWLEGLRDGVLYAASSAAGEITFYSWWEETEAGGICHNYSVPFAHTDYGVAEPIVNAAIYKKPFHLKYFPAQ